MYFDVDFRFLETRSSNNQPEFPWTQIVLFYWFSYLHIHIKRNFKSLCRKSIKHLLWPSNQRLNILLMFTYWQQNINKNRNSKHKFSTGIIIYWIFKIIMCEMFFNHNPFIYTAMFSNFRCITTGIASLLSVHFVGHQKANDVIESCSARLASPSF